MGNAKGKEREREKSRGSVVGDDGLTLRWWRAGRELRVGAALRCGMRAAGEDTGGREIDARSLRTCRGRRQPTGRLTAINNTATAISSVNTRASSENPGNPSRGCHRYLSR